MHQPLGGKTRKLATQEAGDFRLIDFQDVRGASLRKPPRPNRFGNAHRKVGLGETFFRIGQTNISENVAAALLDFNLFADAKRNHELI